MKRCVRCKTTFDSIEWDCPVCKYIPEIKDGYLVFAPELAQQNDTYTTDFFSNLAALEKGHFWFEARNQLLLWAVGQYFPDVNNFLEIGCGTGFVLECFETNLPNAALFGSDLLVESFKFASQRVPTATLMQMDARDIPYKEEFDLIGAFDVIEHIEEDEIALSQIYNAIKPGGGIIITVPQHQFLWSAVDDLSYHKRRYNRDELVNKVQKAGFRVLKTTSFVSLLMPLMLLSRSRKSDKEEFDLYGEFKISPLLNKVLSLIMAVEFLSIRASIPFHFGGSRLLIAVRPD